MWVRFLGREDPLEEGMVIHYSILAWRIPWTEEPGRLQSMELQRVRPQQSVCARTHTHVCMWLTHFAVQQKLTQQCETTMGQ